MQKGGPEDDKHFDVFREVFEFDEEFYFRPGTRILCKTANEIVENRVSRKVRLRKDMNIFLEDFIIKIE